MKKIYLQTSLDYQIAMIVILLVSTSGLFLAMFEFFKALATNTINSSDSFYELGAACGAIVALVRTIRSESVFITITDSFISIPKDARGSANRIQYKEIVPINDIENIDIVLSTNNSRDDIFLVRGMPNHFVLSFLEITKKDGSKSRFFISRMGKKTTEKMIDDLKTRMIKNKNFRDLKETKEMVSKLVKTFIF